MLQFDEYKIKLNNLKPDLEELAQALAGATGSQVVQVIGRRLVLYRKNPKKPVIVLD